MVILSGDMFFRTRKNTAGILQHGEIFDLRTVARCIIIETKFEYFARGEYLKNTVISVG